MRVPVALLAVVLATGCTGATQDETAGDGPAPASAQPTPVATTSTPSETPRASPTARPTPTFEVRVVPVKKDELSYAAFLSPSRNISCAIGHEADKSGWARCDIAEHTWPLPPRPSGCDLDWGSVATVTTTRGARMGECVSDAAGGETVMPYGHALRLGEVECRSEARGVTCEVLRTGHGFFVSKASYRLF